MTNRIHIRLLVTVLAAGFVLAAGSVLAQSGDTTLYLPVVKNETSLPLPPPDEAAQRITLPPGFEIRIFAQNLPGRPRFMAFGPDGHLYASLFDNGQIARFPDRNFDGLSEGIEIAASGLSLPHGIEFHDGWLYVAEGDKVERLADLNGNGSYETKELVTGSIPGPSGHSTRTLHFGPDGKMYVSVGSSSNVNPETDPRRAAILRFNANGTIPSDNPFFNDPVVNKRPLYAWGLRNSVDFLWSPGGQLWADHNGSDGLGDNLPPEEVVIPVQGNASHGWPYCYTPGLGVTSGPEVRDTNVALSPGFTCAQAVPAIFTVPAHSAPLGMTLASGNNFPPAYLNSLYIALHGSWNTTTGSIRNCKVERVLLSNGQPASNQTFASGWRAPGLPCGHASTWGRPADVIFGPYGEMYISDDHGDRIYRVVYVGN